MVPGLCLHYTYIFKYVQYHHRDGPPILVMENSIPIYFILTINSLFADVPLNVGLPQPP